MYDLPHIAGMFAGACLLIILVYALSRAASFAYFRTRLEYLRSVLHELRKGDKNG